MYSKDYYKQREKSLNGRRITLDSILPIIKSLKFEKSILGQSFLQKDIYRIKLGSGKIKILIWSQMHGNESTGTKAVFDLLNFFDNPLGLENLRNQILQNCTIIIVPILNPDGAELYTRVNAQEIDLNRDAVALKAPESKLLNALLYDFNPKYCFNLHDQRPIFSVGKDNLPATLSFLAPSEDKERTITKGRKETMQVIVAMNKALQKHLPNQMGRYTDEFYPTATGDNFQKAGFNTILIEAGHYENDYTREITRKYNFMALLSGIEFIANKKTIDYKEYFSIPNNKKKYYEYLLKNVSYNNKKIQIGVFLEDKLEKDKLIFVKNHENLSENVNINANKIVLKPLLFSNKEEVTIYINNKL